jgi:hypothetical protein
MFKKVLVLLAALAALFCLIGCGSTQGASNDKTTQVAAATLPESFNGKWHQTKGMDGIVMDAVVTGESIQINMTFTKNDTTGVFWMGSFDSAQATSGLMYSLGDQDAMKNMIFASNETTKTFNYKDGDLSFGFSIMGAKTTVHLSRGAK